MKKIALLIFLLQSSAFSSFSQFNSKSTDSLLIEAKKLYFSNNYKVALPLFSEFFSQKPKYVNSNTYYFVANSWLHQKNDDSTIIYYKKFVDKSHFSYYNELVRDSAWIHLNKYKAWNKILIQIKKNQKRRLKTFAKNADIMTRLTQVMNDDQNNRSLLDVYIEVQGRESHQVDSLWKLIGYTDSINIIYVTQLLDKHKAWYGGNEVGYENSATLFLVIQHADVKTQEKYYPIMKQAVLDEKLDAGSLALLEDRINIFNGRKQVYGSQIGYDETTKTNYLLPVEDPDNLNFRRELVELGMIESYLEYFSLVWDLEAYKKNLPYYEELLRQSVESHK
jgi:hypothetical protein